MKNQRKVEEAGEGLATVKNDAPESKFQKDQQIEKSTGFSSNTGDSSFRLDKKKAPGSQLKQEVASSVVRDASLVGGSAGDGASFSGLRSSGSFGGIAGAANATPNVGKPSRSDSRTGKKLDRNSTKLNFIPSDQVLTEWDESKPLADAADQDQGYNGTYRNEFARSQKRSENVPGALMFERSLDLCLRDKIYFGQGQYVKQALVTYNNELTKVPVPNAYGQYENPSFDNYTGGAYGNYLAHNAHYKFDRFGKLIYLYFDEDDLACSVDEHDANKSSLALKIAMNRAELYRETMDTKAGDEKADIWTPFARAVAQPTATVGFLAALEADVGNEIITAYRKSNTCFSYQLNRAHKDGQDDFFPGTYASTGLAHCYVSRDYAAAQLPSGQAIFNQDCVAAGYASTMIRLYDSPTKYNTKADFLVQPRGYRMHMQTADNNMDPFWADKLFIAAYDANEVFSTIDREYDPNGLVYMTDKCAVVHRLSWNKQGAFIRNSFQVALEKGSEEKTVLLLTQGMVNAATALGAKIHLIYKTETAGSISVSSGNFVATSAYEAENGNARLVIAPTAPTPGTGEAVLTISTPNTTGGVSLTFKGTITIDWAEESGVYRPAPTAKYMYSDLRNKYVVEVKHPMIQGLIDYFEKAVGPKYYEISGGKDITVPTIHSTQFFSLWSLLLCAATPFIVKARINSMRDLLYYEKNVEYPFRDALIPITDVKTKAYVNFGFVDRDTELEVKRMNPVAALSWILPETFQQVGAHWSDDETPVLESIDVLMPWYTNQNEMDENGAFKDDQSAMSFPSIRSGVRFAALDSLYSMTEKDVRLSLDMVASWKNLHLTSNTGKAYKYSSAGDGQMILNIDPTYGISALDLMSLPRQLGWVMDAPYGVLTPTYADQRSVYTDVVGTSCFRLTYWTGKNALAHSAIDNDQDILAPDAVNIERAANFSQVWFTVLASGTVPPVDHGFLLSMNQALAADGSAHFGETLFKPYAAIDDTGVTQDAASMNPLLSLQKVLWTRIQKLPFVISPFDLKAIPSTAEDPEDIILSDQYDFMYCFGLGGFRASDYRESVYNRDKEIVNQGYLFVSDPWVEASPLFKEGVATGGVSVSKGFEL